MQKVVEHAVQLVARFFRDITVTERELVPSVLKSDGTWMASFDESILGIFYLNESEQQRVKQYQEKGWPLFPGFMVGERKKPDGAPVAMKMGGFGILGCLGSLILGSNELIAGLFFGPILLGIFIWALKEHPKRKARGEAEYAAIMATLPDASKIWNRLHYCFRDDIV